jgi:hypothetical protein
MKMMLKGWMAGFLLLMAARTDAQTPVISQIISAAVRAVDLAVQRIQTQTIILQEAQQVVQNVMSGTELNGISDWVDDLKDLYSEYFAELAQVKTVISGYHKVTEIIEREEQLLAMAAQAMTQFREDPHFSAGELSQMASVYSAIVKESEQNVDQLTMVLTALTTQMTDRQRMSIIDRAGTGIDGNWRDLQTYTNENELLSLQRAGDAADYETLKKMYGL